VKATLTYHSIDDSGSPVSVPAAVFDAHVRWLASGRVRVVDLDALSAGADGAGGAVAVTFDDGFANSRPAIERLLDHGLPVTIFVASRHVGRTNAWGGADQPGIPTSPLLTWAELEGLMKRGARVEAHSRTHPRLTRITATELDDELGGCQEDLRAKLGVSSRHLAYPYGDLDERVLDRSRAFYAFGHTTDMRLHAAGQAPMRLPRIDMYYYRSPNALDAWGQPRFARRVAAIRARRAVKKVLWPDR
jgi:peptidoglycan/xylan/chitin deacetylase (PgdA/CDA1 family)